MTDLSVHDMVEEVLSDLERSSVRYPCFDPRRFPAVARTVTVHLPDRTRDDRVLAALVSLWIIAFDELVDTVGLPVSLLEEVAGAFKWALRRPTRSDAGSVPIGDTTWLGVTAVGAEERVAQLYHALMETDARLRQHQAPAQLVEYYESRFTRMVDAIVAQRRLGAAHYDARDLREAVGAQGMPFPASRDWSPAGPEMELLQDSIGVPYYLAACVLLYREPALVNRLPQLHQLVESCARAIRMANDLRTWAKDETEQNLNTVVLAQAALKEAHAEWPCRMRRERAVEVVERQLELELERLQRLVEAVEDPYHPAEGSLVRLTAFVTAAYADRVTESYHPD